MALNYSLLLLLLVLPGALPFIIIPSQGSMTHADITRTAIVRQLTQVCRSRSSADGAALALQDEGMSAARLLTTCFQLDSLPKFVEAFEVIKDSNVRVDIRHVFDEEYHFDSETFEDGRSLISSGLSFIKGSIQQGNFREARERLGQICHTLQDFYSHSNWVELGNTLPNSNLLKSGVSIGNIADVNTPTCTDCIDNNCENNILPEVIQQQKLTSGYFSLTSSHKPDGKCSHGGIIDLTSHQSPVGGINKDKTSASHGHLHSTAAEVATNATVQLLEDIRVSVGDSSFLRLMGITRSSVLCFVIDTTGGMSDVIKEAKRVASSIIDSTQGTANEPSDYILVAFNSSNVGPLSHTTDSGKFQQWMSSLTAGANGAQTVLSLSATEMALRAVPASSYIFVFADAPAKDSYLMSTVTALIESTRSVVNFMLTNPIVSRRRRSYGAEYVSRVSNPANQLYQELAQASGGLAIEVAAASLPQATNVIVDSTTSALVSSFFVRAAHALVLFSSFSE
uniref:von Willebrand factor A domain-containing protein 7-like n=1 Tax=Scleropages formosus TaxID=113540 RepID=A0A8C9SUF5_SCLFO